MTLDILIPTYRRAHKLAARLENLHKATTDVSYNVIVITEIDDTETVRIVRQLGGTVLFNALGRGYPGSMNTAVRWTLADVLFLGSDDLNFHPGWAQTGLAAFRPGLGVVGTNDLDDANVLNGTHSTHSFVRRDYALDPGAVADEPGLLVHPGYGHYYTDVELIATALARGAFAPCLASVVEHLRGKEPVDETWRVKREAFLAADTPIFRQREPLWRQSLAPFTK